MNHSKQLRYFFILKNDQLNLKKSHNLPYTDKLFKIC